jgi:hypothetical protein
VTSVWTRWWVHALLYLAILVAAAPFVDWDVTFTPDEGLYGLQVDALQEGSWAWEYPAAETDPDGEWLPLVNIDEREGRYFPYLRHPTYVVMLWGAEALAGEVVGLHLVAFVGAVAAAIVTWFLAREVRAPPALAFWVAALGPIVVNAHVMWAHTLSAALAGGAAIASIRLVRQWSTGAALGLGGLLAASVLVRAEGLLFAAAVALVVPLLVLRRRGIGAAVLVAAPTLAAPAAFVAERWLTQEIVSAATGADGGAGELRGIRETTDGYLEGRVEGAWRLLMETGEIAGGARVLGLLAVALVVLAAVMIRRRMDGHERVAPMLLGAGAALLVVRTVVDPGEAIGGIVAAWPVALVGLALVTGRDLNDGVGLLLAVTGVFAAAVILTQYEIAGGLEWGGRFLSPALPLLAVAAAVGLTVAVDRLPQLKLPLVALALVPAAAGLVMLDRKAVRDDAILEAVTRPGGHVIVTHDRVMPRFGWRVQPPGGWMLVPPEDLPTVLRRLDEAGAGGVTVVQPLFSAPEALAGYDHVEDMSSGVDPDLGWGVWLVRLRPGPASGP